MAAVRQAW